MLALFTSIPGLVEIYKPGGKSTVDEEEDGLTRKVTEAGGATAFERVNEYSFTLPGETLPTVGRPRVSSSVPSIVVKESEKFEEREPKTFILTKHDE